MLLGGRVIHQATGAALTAQSYMSVGDVADGYDAEILRLGPDTPMAAARRKVMMMKFARHAALRLQAARDPAGVAAEFFSAS